MQSKTEKYEGYVYPHGGSVMTAYNNPPFLYKDNLVSTLTGLSVDVGIIEAIGTTLQSSKDIIENIYTNFPVLKFSCNSCNGKDTLKNFEFGVSYTVVISGVMLISDGVINAFETPKGKLGPAMSCVEIGLEILLGASALALGRVMLDDSYSDIYEG